MNPQTRQTLGQSFSQAAHQSPSGCERVFGSSQELAQQPLCSLRPELWDHMSGSVHSCKAQIVLIIDHLPTELSPGISELQVRPEERWLCEQLLDGTTSLVIKPWPVLSAWQHSEADL